VPVTEAKPGPVLNRRELNRATLARQSLLARADLPVVEMVHHLVGMQAQLPLNPYIGLWSRLDGFTPAALSRALVDRHVVRIVLIRGTIHLVTADDALWLRPLVQPVLDGEAARHRDHRDALRDLDLREVLAFGREYLATPRTGPELRAAMAERFPSLSAPALAFACRNFLALVQVPPRGVWGESAQVTTATVESWLGRPLAADPSIDEVVLRYLAAFGPATVADVAAWSRLTGFREVLDRLRPRLRVFRDERGRELFDIPDAPRPGEDVVAPPRFLPEYDNVLLSHADRSRFSPPSHAPLTVEASPMRGAVLDDGLVAGMWWQAGGTLVVRAAVPLSATAHDAIAAEGARLLTMLLDGDEASPDDVRVESAG
jgi:hypothetical protein